MDSIQLTNILDAQEEILDCIVHGLPLEDCLNHICSQIEQILAGTGARASILLLEGMAVRHGAAPSLPKDYLALIDGATIGPNAGSCGSAMYLQKQVIVTDIAHDPLWENYRQAALPFGLRACWSTPIISSSMEVMGSFAVYYDQVMEPTPFHLMLINRFTRLSSLALERNQCHEREQSLLEQLQMSNVRFQSLVEVLPDLAMVIDDHGTYVDVFGSCDELLYAEVHKILGKSVNDVIPPLVGGRVMELIQKTVETGQSQLMEYELDVPKGSCVFEGRTSLIPNYSCEHPGRSHVLWMARDITLKKHAQRTVEQLAFYDSLTGLPNRRLMLNRLEQFLEKANRSGQVGALLFLDLDDFKRINDSLGHDVGDMLLCQAAKRLKGQLRLSDTIARIGGDEFVVLLENTEQGAERMVQEAQAVAKKILACLQQPFTLHDGEYSVSSSIGICLLEGGRVSVHDALKRADIAMYRAKSLGGERLSFYDPGLQQAVDHRLQIEGEIRTGLEKGEFTVFYQPQLDPQGRIIGAEALIRWLHPRYGMVLPSVFLVVAERSGLINRLQDFVINNACRFISTIQADYLFNNPFAIAINISALQFSSNQLEKQLKHAVMQQNIDPRHLKLEITENTLMSKKSDVLDYMRGLRESGFRISLDDFGTGYSSLSYLHSLPIDEIKIDKSFVQSIHSDSDNTAIVDAIVSMADHFRFDIVAEGVETEIQATVMNSKKVNGLQGYYYAKPMAEDRFQTFLCEGKHSLVSDG